MAGEIQNNVNTGFSLPVKMENGHINVKYSSLKKVIEFADGSNNGEINNQSKVKIVSKEPYKYNNAEGILIKLDDGSLMFQSKKQINGKDVLYQYKFKNEKALNKKQPSSEILNHTNLSRRTIINYKYHRNGKVKNKETRIGQNKLARQEQFDKNGKIENSIIYDKNGKLLKETKFTHNKDNSVDAKVYDKDNKLAETVHLQYKSDGKTPISSESRYPDGKLKSESKFHDNGKIQTKDEYYENGAVKSKTEYWDNGVIKEQEQYDKDNKITNKISAEIDGNFGASRQISDT